MSILFELVRYFTDRHTLAIAALFTLYAVVIAWCGTSGAAEVQQRSSAVAARYRGYDASHFSTVPVARTVSVAVVRLRDSDAAYIHGGPLSAVAPAPGGLSAHAIDAQTQHSEATSQEKKEARRVRMLPLRWRFALPIGDVNLLDTSQSVHAAGVVPAWVAAMEGTFPGFAFVALNASTGGVAAYPGGELVRPPPRSATQEAMEKALYGVAHRQGLRVLLLGALPTPAQLRSTGTTTARSASADALFVFATSSAIQAWSSALLKDSAAATATDAEAPQRLWWQLPSSPPRPAWEAVLESTSQSRGEATTPPSATPTAETQGLPSSVRAALEQQRTRSSGTLPESVTDVLRFVPRLALHLAHVHGAPYVVLASWCTVAETYTWVTAAAVPEAGDGAQAYVQMLCLRHTELVEITPSLMQVARTATE